MFPYIIIQFAHELWNHCFLQSLDESLVPKRLTLLLLISSGKGSSIPTVFLKETKSATMNIFRFVFYFLFKSFVKVELSYAFTIYLFTIAENYFTEK